MIVTTRIGAATDIAHEHIARDGTAEPVARELLKEVLRQGEQWGYFIRPQSVRIRPRPDLDDPVMMTSRFEASWDPNPREGCYFINGPLDGEMQPIDADDAPDTITFPGTSDLQFTADLHPELRSSFRYARAGKDPERDCWVYEHVQ